MIEIRRFYPDAKGWVVRLTQTYKDRQPHVSWWYGPNHGWGRTSGPLDYSVAVFDTKKEATQSARQFDWHNFLVERVADAVAFEITECDRRKVAVLAGDRSDKKEIAAANDRTKAYLQGKRIARR